MSNEWMSGNPCITRGDEAQDYHSTMAAVEEDTQHMITVIVISHVYLYAV
jgi:hypothetical protein